MIRRRLGVLLLVCWSAALLAQSGDIVSAVRKAAWAKDLPAIERQIAGLRAQIPGLTPAKLEALSWSARGASFAKNWDKAEAYARETLEGSRTLLKSRTLDADESLPIALGAAIEVLGAVEDARGDRGGAVEFLRAAHARYKGTSIEARIQKNILLLTLEGQPAPPIAAPQWVSAKPKSLDEMKGQVVLLFFWAHWCGDCKKQGPILDRIHSEYSGRALTIVGPTQLYGYVTRGETATPKQEMNYLRGDYHTAHPIPAWMPVPVSNENFLKFGVSTTPTLLLVDRQGIVRLYHPGVLSYEDLVAKIEPLLSPRT
ncbi:MAG: TlpA family protein disulfide reductase [Acidobacteria bacterium]|nr:TlpA family protein disulfide reductase [Acidobacteriota bacterium]